MSDVPLLIEFAPQTSLYREPDRVSQLPIVRNGPPGTFVVFPDGMRVSLPTDQIVFADDNDGAARVGFGGMSFTGSADGQSDLRASARVATGGAAVPSAESGHEVGSADGLLDSRGRTPRMVGGSRLKEELSVNVFANEVG